MKLGIGLNIFSSVELLKPALLQVRKFAYHIVGVFNKTSFNGDPAPDYYLPLLQQLLEEKLIDRLVEHHITPTKVPIQMQKMQREKYEIARRVLVEKGCSHLLNMDCDEFWEKENFANAMNFVSKYSFSISNLWNYVGTPCYRERTVAKLHVPFIQKSNHIMQPWHFPQLLDLSRTIETSNFIVIPSNIICMHHMTGVRFNELELQRKFQGHAHFLGEGSSGRSDYIQRMRNPNKDIYDEVPDRFGILEYWKNEFTPFYQKYMGK